MSAIILCCLAIHINYIIFCNSYKENNGAKKYTFLYV